MANCPYCGEMHSPLYRCDAAMAKKPVAKTDMAKKPMAKTTYRYRDPDKRRARCASATQPELAESEHAG